MLFIDTAGTKPAVTIQSLSIANFTIFQMIMWHQGTFWLMYVCMYNVYAITAKYSFFSYIALLHVYCEYKNMK